MSCYFRYLKDLFAESGVRVTAANKRALDQAVHAAVGVPYKHCMPACWSKVKTALEHPQARKNLIAAIKRVR